MTAVLLQSPSHFPSSPSSSLSCNSNDGSRQTWTLLNPDPSNVVGGEDGSLSVARKERRGGEREGDEEGRKIQEEGHLSLLALLLAIFRKSLAGCRTVREEELLSMDISPPMNVRHIAHVTFDRFHGFLGLPVEFEPEVPMRAPSASTSVFGVSTESMQCTYDPRGNSVPTILILMQRRLYEQGGLQAEGIFRIAANNSQEEHVRDQLNGGIVPGDIDVYCLAGLIKAWFRELPTGVLDSISPEEVMQCQSEEQYAKLVRLLPPTEAGLLDWAINLMADTVQAEPQNKMNAHSIAVVFAPNMTKMEDPMTALMHAVQVMNFLRTLILKTLRERHESVLEASAASHSERSDENGDRSPSRLYLDAHGEEETEQVFVCEKTTFENPIDLPVHGSTSYAMDCPQTSCEKVISEEMGFSTDAQPCEVPVHIDSSTDGVETAVDGPITGIQVNSCHRNKMGQSSNSLRKGAKKVNRQSSAQMTLSVEKSRGISIVSRINSRMERVEAWR